MFTLQREHINVTNLVTTPCQKEKTGPGQNVSRPSLEVYFISRTGLEQGWFHIFPCQHIYLQCSHHQCTLWISRLRYESPHPTHPIQNIND